MRTVIVKEYIRLSKLPCASHKYSWNFVSAAHRGRFLGSYREGSCKDNAAKRNAARRADNVTNLRISAAKRCVLIGTRGQDPQYAAIFCPRRKRERGGACVQLSAAALSLKDRMAHKGSLEAPRTRLPLAEATLRGSCLHAGDEQRLGLRGSPGPCLCAME